MAEVNGMRIAVLKRTATAKVTGIVRGFQYQSEFTIPTQVEEKGMTFRVTEIDDAAFRKCSALTSITIPEGIVRIGKLAFAECSSLTSITIPKTVTQIDCGDIWIGDNFYRGHLFTHCPCLTSIVVEEGNPRYKSIQNGNGIIDKKTNTLIAGDQTTIIPDSVTSIGESAFEICDALTSITIPNSVTSIGGCAFYDCKALTSITIPNSVTSIGYYAFYDCKALTSITIPNSVTSIGGSAFRMCDALTSITIPDSVTSIGDYAFYNCDALTSVTIENEEGKVAIHNGAFPSKAKITYVGKPKELLFIVSKDAATAKITGVGERFKNQSKFVIPTQVEEDGKTFRVTEIADAAFSNSSALTSITILEGVVRIGKLAFANCPRLTSITIPKTVTQIDCGYTYIGEYGYHGHLFTNCPSLTSIVVEEGNPRYKSIQNGNGIIDKKTNTLIAGDQTTIIPKDVINIGKYAFAECKALTSITIPNSVTSIEKYAFAECKALTSITIPNSVTSISEGAFAGCRYLISITIPNSVRSIGGDAFRSCDALTSVTIPDSVTKIEFSAFRSCDALTSVTIGNSVTSIGEDAFSQCKNIVSITVANGNTTYNSRNNCNAIIETRTSTLIVGCRNTKIFEGITSIGKSAFYGCQSLTSITIPNSVKSIGNWAFARCPSLSSVNIPNNVTSIGEAAFKDCDALTSVTIGNSVTSIGEDAFLYCKKLTSVTIENEEGNISIGKNAFPSSAKIKYIIKFKDLYFADSFKNSFCAKIVGVVEKFKNQSEFTIPTQFEKNGKTFRVTEIADAAFRNCSALTSITIPEGIERIGKLAFAECSSLTSITIPKTVTQIESGRVDIGDTYYRGHLFTNCSSLTSIVVEEGNPRYKSIQNGNGIIDKTTNTLIAGDQTTSIPKDVINIGEYAFYSCDALTSVTIPDSVTSIGNGAFMNCYDLTSVTIPNSVTSIGYKAFRSCDKLTSITIPNSVTSIGDYAFSYCDKLTSVTIENEEGKVAIGNYAFPSNTKINYHLTLLTKLLKLLKYFNKK